MRDNGFARAQAAYEALTPEDVGWYADDASCPECDGDTNNWYYGEPAECDDCQLVNCEVCDGEVRAADLHEWHNPHTHQSYQVCLPCYHKHEPSPAEDGRW